MAKITYATKVGINPKTVHINQVWDDDMNEIKAVVNGLDDGLITLDEGIEILGTRVGGDLAITIGDYDDSGNSTIIDIDDASGQVEINANNSIELVAGDTNISLGADITLHSGTGLSIDTTANSINNAVLKNTLLTDTRIYEFPNKNGTIALLSDVSGVTTEIGYAISDEITALTTGTTKVTFRMPFAMTLTDVRASLTTAPTGSSLVVDINESGATILSTKLSIDATEKTSETAATPPVISDSSLADDAEITIDIDQVGSVISGAGLKIYLIGTKV